MAQTQIISLPAEIVVEISGYLPNRDVKNLRLACRHLASAALHFPRVFIGPNRRNINVFLAVARHESFRRRVTEIIVDDAILPRAGAHIDNQQVGLSLEPGADGTGYSAQHRPSWATTVCQGNIERMLDDNNIDHDWLRHSMVDQIDTADAWPIYVRMLDEQVHYTATDHVRRALDLGLERFVNLRKVTITSATHGAPFNPLYRTPTIRALPPNINYPRPKGWLTRQDTWSTDPAWEDDGPAYFGFRTLLRALAENKDNGKVTQLVIDASFFTLNGINMSLFDSDNATLRDLQTVVSRPTLRQLHLHFRDYRPNSMQPHFHRQDALGSLLSQAAGGQGVEEMALGLSDAEIFDFLTILPPPSLARLKHLTLSYITTDLETFVDFLAELPPTLETLTLKTLLFDAPMAQADGKTPKLLVRIRDDLRWGQRPRPPKVLLGFQASSNPRRFAASHLRCVWIDADDFLYHGGLNPLYHFRSYRYGVQDDVWYPRSSTIVPEISNHIPLVPGYQITHYR
ncbi:hypothetical protein B0I35DRAFT_415780 [Stachybotrys elegans]|uniref:F-box domain-containing protein n=1 Tax=Stachybotrys elegans TaxID=80388 RepID=A0A8K0WW43_9HYPO|nr:hypothetical protein B0I35DRAFT_415780 [Stachybotrys elegans]